MKKVWLKTGSGSDTEMVKKEGGGMLFTNPVLSSHVQHVRELAQPNCFKVLLATLLNANLPEVKEMHRYGKYTYVSRKSYIE